MLLRFIQVVVCTCHSFILNIVWYLTVWTYYSLFIHSSADGYLACVQIFAVMNNVALNILIPISQDIREDIWSSIAPIVNRNQQQPQHPGASQKYTFTGFIPDLLNQSLQEWGPQTVWLCRWFWFSLKWEKHCCRVQTKEWNCCVIHKYTNIHLYR